MDVLPWALFMSALALVSLLAGILVYAGRPGHPSNRLLALGLLFQSYGEGTVALRQWHFSNLGLDVVFFLATISWVLLYLLFLGTLRVPLARPIASLPGRLVIIAYWAFTAGWVIVRPHDVLTPSDTPPSLLLIGPILVMGGYGLLVAIQMFRRAEPGGLARRQALAYLTAFGIRDVSFLTYGGLALSANVFTFGSGTRDLVSLVPPIANFLSAILLTYGILSVQLFDIDLKIKWGIRRGSLLAIFVAAFVATSEIVSELVTDEVGIPVGVATTMLLVLAIGPLQRLTDRLADRALPNVTDTPEYRLVRRDEVYSAAVRSALQDGVVTERERDMLATLADQLGISSVEALALERRSSDPRGADP